MIGPDQAVTTDATQARVHAVLHCNINTMDAASGVAYYERLGLRMRMKSVGDDVDARSLGLGEHTGSTTWFLYDHRGPRAAPAVELVDWRCPATVPRDQADIAGESLGLACLGLRARDLSLLPLDVHAREATKLEAWVRGRQVPRLGLVPQGGVPVEVVEIDDYTGDDGLPNACVSHVRIRSSDLDRTPAWYGRLGWERLSEGESTTHMSMSVPEDPTFSLECELAPGAERCSMSGNTEGLYRMAMAVEDVPGALARLREAGVEAPDATFIPMPDVPTGGFSVVVLTDPDGTLVELVSRPRSEVRRPKQPR